MLPGSSSHALFASTSVGNETLVRAWPVGPAFHKATRVSQSFLDSGSCSANERKPSELQTAVRGASDDSHFPGMEMQERLNNRILDVRTAAKGAVFKLHAGMCELAVEFMSQRDFHWLHTPHLIETAIDGDQEFFPVDYFGNQAYLAQTTQFHKQMAIAMGFERVFEIGPLFRAEKRMSSRHMTEARQQI